MKYLFFTLYLALLVDPILLFDFSADADLRPWQVVDDGVMGGLSNGQLSLNEEGHAVYQGYVSLENNGGFSSLRCRFQPFAMNEYGTVKVRLKGDSKRYQFRVKSSFYERHSYIGYFETSGEWETIDIPLADLYPAFRGRRLRMDNYPGEQLAEIAFLIGNKKEEDFRLELDWIRLEE